MLRQSSRLARSLAASVRGITSSAGVLDEAVADRKQQFVEQWNKYANIPNVDAPQIISSFTSPSTSSETSEERPTKLTFNLSVPHGQIYSGEQVDMALLPAVTGDFGVAPGHVPTLAQLRPGLLSIHREMDKDVKHYFVSSGFAIVYSNSTADVVATEAVEVEELDPEAVKAGLQEHTSKVAALQGKGDEYELAAAQVGLEVFTAMDYAVQKAK